MEFYYSKKKIFTSLLIWLIVLIVLILAIAFLFSYIDENSNPEPLVVIPLIFLLPITTVVSFGVVRFTYLLLRPEKLMMRLDEQGILLQMNKASKSAGLIDWNEISSIIRSSDNMNKPAIRISLGGHIKGMYQFYITTPDMKKMGLGLTELLDTIMTYYNANKR